MGSEIFEKRLLFKCELNLLVKELVTLLKR